MHSCGHRVVRLAHMSAGRAAQRYLHVSLVALCSHLFCVNLAPCALCSSPRLVCCAVASVCWVWRRAGRGSSWPPTPEFMPSLQGRRSPKQPARATPSARNARLLPTVSHTDAREAGPAAPPLRHNAKFGRSGAGSVDPPRSRSKRCRGTTLNAEGTYVETRSTCDGSCVFDLRCMCFANVEW